MATPPAAMQLVKVARQLPPPLRSFFRRFPPALPQLQTLREPTSADTSPALASALQGTEFLNPFQPQKNPASGRWMKPVYSLRKQADLVNMAREHGVEELLPATIKNTGVRTRKREEHGLRVKGTGVGQKVKGHKWERTLKPRLEERRQAMLGMPKLIQEWKQRGHGKGWKKWPR